MLRAYFAKEGNAIWISHLDLMRVLQRSFRRAGLLLRHSQGFTPHPMLSLALPLSVGVSSQCEIMDFALAEGQDSSMLADRLNAVLPEGIFIYEVYAAETKIKNLTHLQVEVAMEYDRGIPDECECTLMTQLFDRDEILMEKQTKSGAVVTQNIREMIKQLVIGRADANTVTLDMVICAQNPTLNPAAVPAAIAKELPALAPDFFRIRRLAALTADGTVFR